jgi:hypothetical protein
MVRLPLAALALLLLLLAGCVPPNSLTEKVEIVTGSLGPVPADKVGLVRISDAEATKTVLDNERETGWPDPDIAWQDGRCARLAWFEPHAMSYDPDPGPPYPVYLVRLVDPTGAAITWVMVNARTGDLGASIGDPLKSGCVSMVPLT